MKIKTIGVDDITQAKKSQRTETQRKPTFNGHTEDYLRKYRYEAKSK